MQEAKISAREAQLPIRSEKHLKLKFWQTSRFLNVFSDFPLVHATLDVDVARCECGINMVVGALYTLGLTLSNVERAEAPSKTSPPGGFLCGKKALIFEIPLNH